MNLELFLATKTGTPIIGQIASVMGWIMDGIYKMLDGLFGIQNIGLCTEPSGGYRAYRYPYAIYGWYGTEPFSP